jgi:hypothetical protein
MEIYSQIGQDKLVLTYLKNKKNGYFMDIGCCYPKYINNTYLLEKDYSWDGISIDIVDFVEPNGETWSDCRDTIHVIEDALKINYKKLLSDYNAPKVIDYLSMDLEPPSLTLECLDLIPFDEYQFNFISFEVDFGREGYEQRIEKSRTIFEKNGYVYVGPICGGQDDIYVHSSLEYLKNEISLKDAAGIWG